jgi:hypothetical protein
VAVTFPPLGSLQSNGTCTRAHCRCVPQPAQSIPFLAPAIEAAALTPPARAIETIARPTDNTSASAAKREFVRPVLTDGYVVWTTTILHCGRCTVKAPLQAASFADVGPFQTLFFDAS